MMWIQRILIIIGCGGFLNMSKTYRKIKGTLIKGKTAQIVEVDLEEEPIYKVYKGVVP